MVEWSAPLAHPISEHSQCTRENANKGPPYGVADVMSDQTSPGGALALLKTLRKHWPIVASATLLAIGAGLLISKSSTRIYQSSSLVEIEPRASQPLGDKGNEMLEMGTDNYWDTRDYYETQYKIVQSDRVLGAVVRDLALANDPSFLGVSASSSKASNVDFAIDVLRSRLTVEPVRNSRLIYIRVDDRDPARAKRLCDATANAYIEQNFQTALNATSDAVVWLNGQMDHVKQDLEHNENALYDFKLRNDLPSISINDAANMLRVEMQELDTALTHTRTKREELAARNAELSKISPETPDDLPASELLASPYLQELRKQYQDALKERSALLGEGKGENHPLVKRVDEQVATAKTALLAEVRNIQGAVQRDLAIVTRQEAGESAMFEATRKRAVDLNMKEIEYHRLDRTREQNEKLFAMLIDRLKETDLARMMKVNNIRVVDYGVEPKVPIRPRTVVNMAMSMLVGLVLGVVLAWLREQLDSSLKTPDDLESNLGVTFLGLLPEFEEDEGDGKRRQRGKRRLRGPRKGTGPSELVVHTHPLSGIAEAARSIRTNVLFMNPDKPHRKLLVTSAAPAEGKTTVACSIAVALAQGGQRVCIVDCDMRRPRIHRVFDRAGDAGVTNILVGDATLDDVARPTQVDNLWAVPAGPIPPNPADMLHSERFRRLIHELGERFDRVVIDSPPLVAVTDSAIISTVCDGAIFVVRAFKTSKHLATQGLRSLRDVESPILGAVLNAVNLDRHEYNYYHYYYYKREGYGPSMTTSNDDQSEAAPPS
jgi:capsular exopolysaccharide synthesis family protein